MSELKFPVPYIELSVRDDQSETGFRQRSAIITGEFSLFRHLVEIGWISDADSEGVEDDPNWQSAYAEIDAMEWALYGLIRGVGRNSSIGSSNNRAWYGDHLLKGRLFRIEPLKAEHGFKWYIIKEPAIQAAFAIGRLSARIGFLSDPDDIAAVAAHRGDVSDAVTEDQLFAMKMGFNWGEIPVVWKGSKVSSGEART